MSAITFPSADLAARVDLLWFARAEGAPGATLHEFLPDSGVHLVLRISGSGARMVLLGPATEKTCVARDPGAEYVGVRFRTAQAPRLADVRASDLTNGYVDVARIGGTRVDELAERVRESPDVASKQRVLEAVLRRGGPPLVADARCRSAALLLESHGGRMRVEALAAELGLHPRSLERLVARELAMTPKRLARLVRLRNVLGALYAGTYRSLAELALDCGYADQPHLTNDFKELTGRLPGEKDAFRTRPLVSHSCKTAPAWLGTRRPRHRPDPGGPT